MKRTVRFTLNSRKFGSQTTVEGVHVGDDNSCELIISVTDGNKILDLSSETTVATMCGTKPDGTVISRPCSIVNNNIVYTLEKQDTAVSGNVFYQVTVVSDDGISQSIIATAKFTVAVMKNIYIPIYRVLESEPSDWSTNYTAYYRLIDNKYVAVSDISCPAFLKDTFYYLVNPNFNSKDDYGAFQSALVRVENLIGRASDILTILDKKINDNEAEHISNKVSAVDFKNLSAIDYPSINALYNYHINYVEPCYDDIDNLENSKADKLTVDTALSGKLDKTSGSVTTDNIASKAVTAEKLGEDVTNQLSKLKGDLAYLYANVKSFGAVGDGVTDDSNAFIDALNFSKRVYIPKGTYALNKIINIDSRVRLVGAGINETILLVRNGYGIRHIGTSVYSDNPKHKTYLYVSDLTIKSDTEPSTSPMMLLKCSSYTIMDRVRFSGQGTQLKMLEAFDSRFNDCIFEYGGSKRYNTPGVLLCSKIESCEMTNSIVFNGCRFESFYGEAVSTQGDDTNTITFDNCKFESRNVGYIETDGESAKTGLIFYNVMSLFFKDCYFCSPLRSTKRMLTVNLCKGVTITGTFAHMWEKDSTVVDIINPLLLQQCSKNIILELNFFNSFDGDYPKVPITINDTTVTRGFVNGIEI